MGAGWLVYGLVAGSLIAVACWAAEGLCRQHRLPTRWTWSTGLVAIVALCVRMLVSAVSSHPAASAWWQLPLSAPSGQPVESLGITHVVRAALGNATRVFGDWMVAGARLLPPRFGDRALVAWIAASVVVLLLLAVVHLRIARIRRGWPMAELHGHDVYIAPAVGPAVLGLVRPFIVVPRWLLTRDASEQRLVLAHESEHVRARDHLMLSGACLAAAIVPWHPAVWVMLSRLRLAIELDCDARVLKQGVPARTYGALLIDLAGQCAGFTVGATALADEGSHLERRLLAMKPIASRHLHLRTGALAAIGALSILAACEAKLPTSAEVANMDVVSVESRAAQMNLVDRYSAANTTYYIDGVQTEASLARALERNRIASIEVRKIDGASVMRIATWPNGAVAVADSGVSVSVATVRTTGESPKSGTIRVEHHGPKADSKPFNGLLFIDGVQVDNSKLNTLAAGAIIDIQVIKGPKAAAMSSDPAAANGIIRITTKAILSKAVPK
jgi:hypothetical protein